MLSHPLTRMSKLDKEDSALRKIIIGSCYGCAGGLSPPDHLAADDDHAGQGELLDLVFQPS